VLSPPAAQVGGKEKAPFRGLRDAPFTLFLPALLYHVLSVRVSLLGFPQLFRGGAAIEQFDIVMKKAQMLAAGLDCHNNLCEPVRRVKVLSLNRYDFG
jgi:hypothetical protein